ncbi:MAG: hypothetical protein ACO1OC_10585 [Tuberibacillus sp.]
MRGVFIFLIMLIGFGLMMRTIIEFQTQKRYNFKNISILKKQRVSLLIGLIGALIFFITLLMLVF